jgi:F-type H+-transporting ATPase subunit a
MRAVARGAAVAVALLALASGAPAQHAAEPAHGAPGGRDIDIMHHLGNSHVLELPYWKPPYTYSVQLPHLPTLHLGPIALDLSITKHLVFLFLAAVLVALVMLLVSRGVARAQAEGRPPRGFAGAMEAIVLYLRQEVILPTVGPHGEGYVPYLLTVFFFILTCNLLGLLPWGATATGNISVTAALALVSLAVIETSGMRSLGLKGYLGTIFYLPPGLPGPLKPVLLVIMTPIELIGKLAKPFALAVRLFANMTAGHVVVLALIGLTFFFQSAIVGVLASAMATGIMLLELFVAFLQAFVFTLLTSVFIGLVRAEH